MNLNLLPEHVADKIVNYLSYEDKSKLLHCNILNVDIVNPTTHINNSLKYYNKYIIHNIYNKTIHLYIAHNYKKCNKEKSHYNYSDIHVRIYHLCNCYEICYEMQQFTSMYDIKNRKFCTQHTLTFSIESVYELIFTNDIKLYFIHNKDVNYKLRYIINYMYCFDNIFNYNNNDDNINIFFEKQDNYITMVKIFYMYRTDKISDFIFYRCIDYLNMFYNLSVDSVIEEKYLLDNLHDNKIKYIKQTITRQNIFELFKIFAPDNTFLYSMKEDTFNSSLLYYNKYITIFINLIKEKKIFYYKGKYQNMVNEIYKNNKNINILKYLIININNKHKIVDVNSIYHIKLLINDNKKIYYNDEEIFKNYLNDISFYIHVKNFKMWIKYANELTCNKLIHHDEDENSSISDDEDVAHLSFPYELKNKIEYIVKNCNINITHSDCHTQYTKCEINEYNIKNNNNIDIIYKLLKYYNCEYSIFYNHNDENFNINENFENVINNNTTIINPTLMFTTLFNKNIFINDYVNEYYNKFKVNDNDVFNIKKLYDSNYNLLNNDEFKHFSRFKVLNNLNGYIQWNNYKYDAIQIVGPY